MPTAHDIPAALMALSTAALVLLAAIIPGTVSASTQARYTYNIPNRQPLEKTPGYSLLLPMQPVTSITITQAPVTWKLNDASGLQLEFTAPSYLTGTYKLPYAFGPTVRLRAGQAVNIQLVNDLVQSGEITEHQPHAFAGPMDTNLHTHGLWDANGVYDQNQTAYAGQDNIFVIVPAKKSPGDAPASLNFTCNLLKAHLPGMHWYHPHKHGSTTLQTSTSHGAIIVEDDPFWLPANRGLCGCLQGLMATAPEVLLDISLLFFKQAENPAKIIDSPTYQFVSNNSSPKNQLCCDNKKGYKFRGAMTMGNGTDILLVSGAYQPIITMTDGVWYRWRMLYSGAKGWSTFRFLDASMQNSQQCEWMLLSKDGVYVMNIPRKVEAVLMASGNRLEALVRCTLPSKTRDAEFILSASNTNDPFNPGNNVSFATDFFRVWQDEVARIKVIRNPNLKGHYAGKAAAYAAAEAAKVSRSADAAPSMTEAAANPAKHFGRPHRCSSKYYRNPVPESCTPLRPAYAADIRDASLIASGYQPSRIKAQDVNFNGYNNADGLGVTCTVNNQLFAFPDPDPLVLEMGEIVQWTTDNARSHPLHVHTQPFQLTGFNLSNQYIGTELTSFFQVGDFYDTMFVPQIGRGPGSVVMRFQPGPFSGYAVMHCHYLNHEDLGCMKVLQWKCPGYGWVQPVSGICDNFQYPVPGASPEY